MSEDQGNSKGGSVNFAEIISGAKAEDHAEAVADIKQDEQLAGLRDTTDKMMDEYFVTYNYIIGQAKKMIDVFQQKPSEVAIAYAIACGLTIGALAPDKETAVSLLSLSKLLAAGVQNPPAMSREGLEVRAGVLATGSATETAIMMELVNRADHGNGDLDSVRFNPNKGEFARVIKSMRNKALRN